jgi:uncharacterized SAM-binding protein YcdF (DUF218 family)/lysophospholipase L1-like esterase
LASSRSVAEGEFVQGVGSRGRKRAVLAMPLLPRRISRRPFLAGILCGVVLVFAARWFMNRTSFVDHILSPLLLSDTSGSADVIVAMGAGVVGPCVLNLNSLRRTLLAVRLWREQRAPIILFTGGPSESSCRVSQAMAELARATGVPAGSIHVETESHTTRENATYSALLLRSLGARRIIVVTDRLHMPRAQGVFMRVGFAVERSTVPIYEGHVDNVSMFYWGAREVMANFYYAMRGWTSDAGGAIPESSAATAALTREVARYREGPIVILGASYAGGWDLKSVSGIEVINRGVAGEQSFDIAERFERDVVLARPRLAVIWGFINDISRSTPETLDSSLERIRTSYSKMIAKARENGIPIILATELTIRPRDTWSERAASMVGAVLGKVSYQDRVNGSVMLINRWLLEVAAREQLPVLKFQELLSDEAGRRRREYIQDDGSHVTTAGYAAITAYAEPIVKAYAFTH